MSSNETRRATPSLLGITLADLLKLVIASAVVGVILRLFNRNPLTLWKDFFDWLGAFLNNIPAALADMLESLGPALTYVLYGAAIVVPIFVFFKVFGFFFGKR